LGIVDWGLEIGPNPQSPIPNPQSPIPMYNNKIKLFFIFNLKLKINIFNDLYLKLIIE